jgi:hypothetical protein
MTVVLLQTLSVGLLFLLVCNPSSKFISISSLLVIADLVCDKEQLMGLAKNKGAA